MSEQTTALDHGLHVIRLEAENVKNLKAIRLDLSGRLSGVTLLTGRNGAGKSAVLDALSLALTNKGPADPIRHGAQRAEVRLEISGQDATITVERSVTRRGTDLRVSSADGTRFRTPQTLLDALWSNSADAMEFARMKPRDQAEMLRKLAGLDCSDLDQERQWRYDQRTQINRDLARSMAELDRMPPVPPGTPDKAVDVGERLDALKALDGRARDNRTMLAKRDQHLAAAEQFRRKIGDLEDQIVRLMKEKQEATFKAEADETLAQSIEIPPAPTDEEFEAARKAIRDVEAINTAVRARQARNAAKGEHDALVAQADAMTDDLRRIDDQKASRIAKAKFPVEGLSVDDAGPLWNGVPVSQISTGQQISLSARIAMARKPRLRLLVVRDGSNLDAEALDALARTAAQEGYQVLVEAVRDQAGPVGVHIQDGEVVAVDGQEVKS